MPGTSLFEADVILWNRVVNRIYFVLKFQLTMKTCVILILQPIMKTRVILKFWHTMRTCVILWLCPIMKVASFTKESH